MIRMIKHKKKIFALLSFLVATAIFSTGCSSATQPKALSSQSSSSSSSSEVADTTLNYGMLTQAQGILSVPIVLTNNTDSDMDMSSDNFILKAYGHEIKPFQISGEASDFHETIGSGSSYQNVLSYYLGTTLTDKELKHVTLYYKMDNGKLARATEETDETPTGSIGNYTSLSDYYSNTIDYNTQAEDNAKEGTDTASIGDQFSDSDYDKLYFWIIGSKHNKKQIYLKIANKTNTDFYLDFSSFELVNANGNETHIDPNYQGNTLLIPHGKTMNAVAPLERAISTDDAPYTVEFRTNSNSSFFDTKKAFHPVEFVISNSKLLKDAFTVSPDQYPKSGISWKKPKLSGNTLTISVSLRDYFVIHAEAEKFKLVGVNKDGTAGDTEVPISVSPLDINGDETIKLKFNSLEAIKTYKKIVLKYGDETLSTVKG